MTDYEYVEEYGIEISDLQAEVERLRHIERAARFLVDAYDREPVGGAAVAQLRAALEEES